LIDLLQLAVQFIQGEVADHRGKDFDEKQFHILLSYKNLLFLSVASK